MSDQRFKYYTGYEVDNEPSDDEGENSCTNAITHGDASSESSSDEFDRPIREYIEKTMSQSIKTKNSSSKSSTSNTFANEMEDELDQIYHNFISRGTFELPISTQKIPEKKKTVINEEYSDDEQQDQSKTNKRDEEQMKKDDNEQTDKDDNEPTNDDLYYDPNEEEEDEKWMAKERLKSQGVAGNEQKLDTSALGPTDAVLNCPGCMVLICHDCQRHDRNRNQYRAMFVFNCTIDENRIASVSMTNSQKASKKNKNKRFKTEENNPVDDNEESKEDILRPVLCSECGTELGVYEPKEELYHLANVLASH